MLSIEVIRKKKLSRRVESSARSHHQLIAQGLADFYAPFLPDGWELPDFATLILLQEWVLRHHRLDLQEKDRAHEAELHNDKELRRVRDDGVSKLHAKLGEICNTFDGAYGKGRCEELLGFGVGLRAEPEHMLEVAEKAVERLSAPGFELPRAQLGGVALSPGTFRTEIAEPLTDVAAAIQALEHEKDKFDATVTAKQGASRAHQHVYVRLSRLLEELYRIAGYPELADRLRPASHRSKSFRADEEAQAAAPAEAENADSEAPDAEASEPPADAEDAAS